MTSGLRTLLVAWLLSLGATGLAQAGDAFGDGSLLPPTSPRFADPAWYDIVSVELFDTDPISLRLTLGAVDDAGGTVVGLTQPVVEVYLAEAQGGVEALLPGSGLSMPLGTGWRFAVRVSGDGAWGWAADEFGSIDLDAPVALEAHVSGRELTVLTPFARPEGPLEVYAVSGVYDPFSPTGWRGLSRTPSPWAFSSETQRFPVVDVYPGDAAARADALARGELPRTARPAGVYGPGAAPWLGAMGLGVLLALVGVLLRARAARTARRAAAAASPPVDAHVASGGDALDLIDEDEVVRWPPPDAAPRALPAPSEAAAADAPPLPQSDAERPPAAGVDTAGVDTAGAGDTVAPSDGTDGTTETAAPSDAKREPNAS